MGSIKKAFDLTGKTALVTGGSRGLGLQIAEALGEQGAWVVLSSRKVADLKQAQEHLTLQASFLASDVAHPAGGLLRGWSKPRALLGKIDPPR
jgi:NAD(P)-dependent dehydrogenase (short-subunit alcohol dehydrogenase family)